ncbi:MAG: pyridoxamine 5'-phosphate oxidase family protein [Oscillospiraceae bacterium]|nr:pyridoxamine 5'-phosphate oxidase family protein [Oscillospiraceae bacterium]
MRRSDREVKDIHGVLQIVSKAKILRLGLFDGEYPYLVPLHYGYEYAEDMHELIFYMHSAKDGHKLDLIRKNANVCIELDCDIELVSGGDNPCKYGAAYASVMGKGRAEIVEDEQEKIKGLMLLMKNQTGREFEIDAGMAASVAVLKASLAEFSAKSRPKR